MLNIEEIKSKIQSFIITQENSNVPLIYYFLTFLFIVSLRNFFDTITDTTVSLQTHFSIGLDKISLINIISNTFWYIGLASIIIIITYFTVKERIDKISRLILPGFVVLFCVSFIDILLSFGHGFNQSYGLPGVHNDILLRWITFSIHYSDMGMTPGMKTEIFFITATFFGYVYFKKQSIIRSTISAFIVYSAIFFWGCFPFAIKAFVELFKIEYYLTSDLVFNFVLLLLLILGPITYYLYNKQFLMRIIKDMDPLRIAHYILLFFIGIAIGLYTTTNEFILTSENLFQWFFAPAAIIFAGIFALVINGLADKKIDKISNPNRSFIDGTISITHFKQIGIISFILAVLYSAAVDYVTFFIILLVMGNYFIYSAPPLRLKRIPVFSKFFISLNSLILLILGYYYIIGDTNVHYRIVLAFLIGFTILINFIDLKDYKGDLHAGIKTIPTLIGFKRSQILFGLLFLFGYIIFAISFENIYLIGIMVILGFIQFILTNRPVYKEKYVFGTYVLTMIIVLIFILLKEVVIPMY